METPTSPEALHQLAALLGKQGILAQVDQQQAALEAVRPLDAALEARVMQKIRLDWNFHSNVLEGNTLTLGETRLFLMQGLTAKGKPFKDYLDIKGHDAVIDYLIALVRQQERLTEAVLRELHKILLVEPYPVKAELMDGQPVVKQVEPGRYKTLPNHVRTLTGQFHYYATPEETPARMDDLMRWYREAEGQVHPLVVATLFHHTFTAIHPFDDGNGRMARLLSNLILMRQGFVPMVIRQEQKNTYLSALATADQGDARDLLDFFGEQVLSSIDLYLRAVRGEDISELGDFDKRLALLRREMETAGNPVKRSIEAQQQVFAAVMQPLMERLIPKYELVDDFFLEHSTQVGREVILGGEWGIGGNDRRQLLAALQERWQQGEWSRARFRETWHKLKSDPVKDLSQSIELVFNFDDFKVVCEGKQWVKPYGASVTEEELDQMAAQILDQLYKSLESLLHPPT